MQKKLRLNYDKIAGLLSLLLVVMMVTVVILFGLLGEKQQTNALSDWYNGNWSNRIKVTINNSQVPNTDQTDFPVYIDLADLPASFLAL